MSWKNQLQNGSVAWLLEPENLGVCYLALRDLLDLSSDDRKLKSARKASHVEGCKLRQTLMGYYKAAHNLLNGNYGIYL